VAYPFERRSILQFSYKGDGFGKPVVNFKPQNRQVIPFRKGESFGVINRFRHRGLKLKPKKKLAKESWKMRV
jgi:hypothetical protein